VCEATANQLTKMGDRLLLVGRNCDNGGAAEAEIVRTSGSETITFLQADLSLVDEVRRAAEHIRGTFRFLNV
jgi:NAD(P)-dependent dehydrogenase (short-subunit alcohol dehydrogenase family)